MAGYFSERRGLRTSMLLADLRTGTKLLFERLVASDDLAEWLGWTCVDHNDSVGSSEGHPEIDVLLETGRGDLWPVEPVGNQWSEDAIFDLLEFLVTKVSTAVKNSEEYHSYAECGYHYTTFTQEPARGSYVTYVNALLSRYGDGWEMIFDAGRGVIREKVPHGLDNLLSVPVGRVNDNVTSLVTAAVRKYRTRGASREDRRDAVRDLGDVLELLRNEAKVHLGKTESDLFNILNNFGIRHNTEAQKSDYDPIWLAALFYHYLAMIHVLTRRIAIATTGGQ